MSVTKTEAQPLSIYSKRFDRIVEACILTPKGLGVPYVGFSDSGQAVVNTFYFYNF
jgi:hypothetical protein